MSFLTKEQKIYQLESYFHIFEIENNFREIILFV